MSGFWPALGHWKPDMGPVGVETGLVEGVDVVVGTGDGSERSGIAEDVETSGVREVVVGVAGALEVETGSLPEDVGIGSTTFVLVGTGTTG